MRILTVATAAALALTTASALAGQGAALKEGSTMPAFSLKGFDGKAITNATLKGKPYVLDFWATWCGPCKAASPTMQMLHTKYGKKGLMVIGADVLENDKGKAARKYPAEHKYTYKFANADALFPKFQVNGIPFFVFVDKNGKIVKTFQGFDNRVVPMFEKLAQQLTK